MPAGSDVAEPGRVPMSPNRTGSELGALLPDEGAVEPGEVAAAGALRDQVERALGVLGERERRVLALRFGLAGERGRTLEEVGQLLGVTRERVRQIEAQALRKLRHPRHSAPLREYLA